MNMFWPLRPDATYSPKAPNRNFTRLGYQKTPGNPWGYHFALDITCPRNTLVQTPEACVIAAKDASAGDLGRIIVLKGIATGWWHVFAHLGAFTAHPVGTKLSAKYSVGRVGTSGNVSGPHLHWEIRQRGTTFSLRDPRVDPYPFALEAFKARRF